jgi:hypothetical protein
MAERSAPRSSWAEEVESTTGGTSPGFTPGPVVSGPVRVGLADTDGLTTENVRWADDDAGPLPPDVQPTITRHNVNIPTSLRTSHMLSNFGQIRTCRPRICGQRQASTSTTLTGR